MRARRRRPASTRGTSGTGRGQGAGAASARRPRGRRSGRAAYAGRGPKGYRRSDERIREEISDRLTEHDELDASEIEVCRQGWRSDARPARSTAVGPSDSPRIWLSGERRPRRDEPDQGRWTRVRSRRQRPVADGRTPFEDSKARGLDPEFDGSTDPVRGSGRTTNQGQSGPGHVAGRARVSVVRRTARRATVRPGPVETSAVGVQELAPPTKAPLRRGLRLPVRFTVPTPGRCA